MFLDNPANQAAKAQSKQQNMLACKPLFTSIANFLLLLSSSTASIALPAESADNSKDLLPRTDVTPLSVSDACKHEHGSGFSAQAVESGCNDWVCVRGNERNMEWI